MLIGKKSSMLNKINEYNFRGNVVKFNRRYLARDENSGVNIFKCDDIAIFIEAKCDEKSNTYYFLKDSCMYAVCSDVIDAKKL
jgi:hypothetical protein